MIRNIILPEHIGSYYLFAKRIIGFDIGRTRINATSIYLKGNSCTLERSVEYQLPTGTVADYHERVIAGLQALKTQLPHAHEVRCALPSSLVVFKELRLPFTDPAKIKQVVPFEAEPLLPFNANEAMIDVIVTQTIAQENSSIVLIAATQEQNVATYVDWFAQAELPLDILTVDLIAFYSAYKQLPSTPTTTNQVLIETEPANTRMAFIEQGQLRFVRTLNQGLLDLAKTVGDTIGIPPAEAMDMLLRFGLEPQSTPKHADAIRSALTSFWNTIAFTVRSFSTQAHSASPISTLVLFGSGAHIKGLAPFVTDLLDIPCQVLNTAQFLTAPLITNVQKNSVPDNAVISVCTALPTPVAQGFTLLQRQFTRQDVNLFTKQMMTACLFTLLIIGSLLGTTIWRNRSLSAEYARSQQEALDALRDRFPRIAESDVDNLDDFIEEAQKALAQEERLLSFASPSRPSFLKYLLELTSRIDKQGLGMNVERISMTEDSITLKAQVKDYNALKLLEHDLRQSPSFTVEPQEDPNFTMVIRLPKVTQGR